MKRKLKACKLFARGMLILLPSMLVSFLPDRLFLAHHGLRADQPCKVDQSATIKLATDADAQEENSHFPIQTGNLINLQTGKPAAGLDLPPVNGRERFLLKRWRGVKPVVLAFGSFSCDLFHAKLPELVHCHQRNKERAAFAFIGILGWPHKVPGFEFMDDEARVFRLSKDLEQRRELVRKALRKSALSLPAYLDDSPDQLAAKAYGAFPARLVIVDAKGLIAADFRASGDWDWKKVDQVLDAACK